MTAMRRHPLVAYFVLAYAMTWVLVFPLVLQGLGLTGELVPSGWHALGALGPISAALVVTAGVGGRPALAEFAGRMLRWRVGTGWFLVSVFSPFLLFALATLILWLFGSPWPDFGRLDLEDLLSFFFLAGLLYGIGEESGWRGFALPRLQSGRSALAATLILTVFWALWHIPFFFYRFEFGAVQVAGFFIGLLAGAIWLTCLYNSTGGSILMVAAWHSAWNLVNQVAMVVSVEILSAMSVLVMILAGTVVVVFGSIGVSPRGKQEAPPFAAPGTPRVR
jgi:membrane protease YdiL (CAAX protease family)